MNNEFPDLNFDDFDVIEKIMKVKGVKYVMQFFYSKTEPNVLQFLCFQMGKNILYISPNIINFDDGEDLGMDIRVTFEGDTTKEFIQALLDEAIENEEFEDAIKLKEQLDKFNEKGI